MRENIFAYTAPGGAYPGYVSINRTESGDVEVTVREPGTSFAGVYVCANASDPAPGRCTPGGPTCNNYCNLAPQNGPMQPAPMPCQHNDCGKQASFVVPASAWPGL